MQRILQTKEKRQKWESIKLMTNFFLSSRFCYENCRKASFEHEKPEKNICLINFWCSLKNSCSLRLEMWLFFQTENMRARCAYSANTMRVNIVKSMFIIVKVTFCTHRRYRRPKNKNEINRLIIWPKKQLQYTFCQCLCRNGG